MTGREIFAQLSVLAMQKPDPNRYSVVYDKYMYEACVKLLSKFDDAIMRFSRDNYVKHGAGAIMVEFDCIDALVKGDTKELKYVKLDDIKRVCKKSIKWSTYENIDFNNEFVVCIKCIDIDGNLRWHTVAFQDEPGPSDVTALSKYFAGKTRDLCYTCRKEGEDIHIFRCRKCGVYMWYCGDRCRERDGAHHAAFCNPAV